MDYSPSIRSSGGHTTGWLRRLFMHMIAARKLHGRRAAQAALLGLTDRQLADAGIDLTLAGRGKAADVAFDPNIEARS